MASDSSVMDTDKGLLALFEPRSIAVVGASASPTKIGYQMVHSLATFPGHLFPINPKETSIHGFSTYARLVDIPAQVDLAILTVPAQAVPGALRDCAVAGVRAVLVCAGGFAESGEVGQALQQEVTHIIHETGIRLLGPNTSGYINPVNAIQASFVPGVSRIQAGTIAVVAQSGGVNHALAFLAHNDGIGLRLAVGLGNAINVGFADVFAYLAQDEHTQAIALHMEGVVDGRALIEAIERITPHIPVGVLKVGRADVNDFARSHTGVLTGNYALTRSALTQVGAVVVEDTLELLDATKALACARLPAKAASGVGIVTSQAGPGLLITDVLRSARVPVPELSLPTRTHLRTLLPPLTAQHNPVDTGRPDKTFSAVLTTVAADSAVDAVLAYALHEPDALDPVTTLTEFVTKAQIPVIFATGGIQDTIAPTLRALAAMNIAAYTSLERSARAMRALIADAQARARSTLRQSIIPHMQNVIPLDSVSPIDEDAAKSLLETFGIRTPRRRVCNTHEDAVEAITTLTKPVAVKVLNAAIVHKSDVGGVHLHIDSLPKFQHALHAIDTLPKEGISPPHRYLIEEMAPQGVELIVGGTRDESFGPVVLLGLGGITAEVLQDVALRLAPLAEVDAEGMIDSLKGHELLFGYRGLPAVNRAELVGVLLAVSQLLVIHPEIAELDINPLRVTEHGLYALDAIIVTGKNVTS